MFRRFVLSAVLIAPSVVWAQTETNRLPEVVVTGTRLPESVETTPTAITVVPREQIELQQTRTVLDVLAEQPGISFGRTGQPGGQTSLFLRGANFNHTLLLVDGIRVNSAFNGGFDFANLPVDNIDHIEILRGPQGTLYGSEAMGGAINIVTKRGAPKPTGSAMVEAGNNDSFRTRESLAASYGKLSLAGEGGYFTTDNDRLNSYDHVWSGSGRASYQLLDRLSVGFLGTYQWTKAGVPNDRFTNDPNDFLRNENSLLAGSLDAQPTENWDAKLIYSHANERQFFSQKMPNPPWGGGAFTYQTVDKRDQFDLQNVLRLGDHHRVLFGASFDNNAVNHINQSDYGTNRINRVVTDKALYGQYEFTPVERLTLTAGGRVDEFSSAGTHGTYRVGARWTTPVTETILRANLGTGFRAPSIRDLYQPPAFGGNPDLQPERSIGWDVGAEQPLADGKLRVGATYFQNEFDALMGRSLTTNIIVNIDRATTAGIETFVVWMPVADLTLRGSYTWLALAEERATNHRLQRRPEHTGSVSADYRFLERFTAHASALIVGDRDDAFFDLNTFMMTPVENGGYVKVDIGLSCDVCKNFSVFGRVENLLDDRYEEAFGYPALGRVFWAGGTVRF